jgi:hypothetical protein
MSMRAGWTNLSAGQRVRYTRALGQGNARLAERLYTRGASLKRARGHGGGAARPAPARPGPAPEVRQRMDTLRELTRLNRAVGHVAANAHNTRKHGKPNEAEIRRQLSRFTDNQLDRVAHMTADEQLRWLRGESEGPGEAAEFWYHGSQGWGA